MVLTYFDQMERIFLEVLGKRKIKENLEERYGEKGCENTVSGCEDDDESKRKESFYVTKCVKCN